MRLQQQQEEEKQEQDNRQAWSSSARIQHSRTLLTALAGSKRCRQALPQHKGNHWPCNGLAGLMAGSSLLMDLNSARMP
jgi:hypothetical protein